MGRTRAPLGSAAVSGPTGSEPDRPRPNGGASDVERTAGLVDPERLGDWMDTTGLPGDGEPVATRFISGGASNEIFEVSRGDHRWALRRPPRQVPPGRNETMMREYRILAALDGTGVPHARAAGACDDPGRAGSGLLPDGLRGRVVAHQRAGVARAVLLRPRRPGRVGVRAGGGHRPAVPGRLEGEGPGGSGEARRVPRAAGGPLVRAPRPGSSSGTYRAWTSRATG